MVSQFTFELPEHMYRYIANTCRSGVIAYVTLLGLIQGYRYSSLLGNRKSVLYLSETFLITK